MNIRRLSPAAPTLPTAPPLVVFDGVCVLCSRLVRWIVARDPDRQFRFTSAQDALGQALYQLDTLLLVVDGVAYGKLRAVVEIVVRLGGVWRAAGLLKALPAPVGDWAYDRIARNRYALFGRRETCWLPTPDMADRMV